MARIVSAKRGRWRHGERTVRKAVEAREKGSGGTEGKGSGVTKGKGGGGTKGKGSSTSTDGGQTDLLGPALELGHRQRLELRPQRLDGQPGLRPDTCRPHSCSRESPCGLRL